MKGYSQFLIVIAVLAVVAIFFLGRGQLYGSQVLNAERRTASNCPVLESFNTAVTYPIGTKFAVDWTDIYDGTRSTYVVTLKEYAMGNPDFMEFNEMVASTDGSRKFLTMYKNDPYPDFYLCGFGIIEPPIVNPPSQDFLSSFINSIWEFISGFFSIFG